MPEARVHRQASICRAALASSCWQDFDSNNKHVFFQLPVGMTRWKQKEFVKQLQPFPPFPDLSGLCRQPGESSAPTPTWDDKQFSVGLARLQLWFVISFLLLK